MSDHQILFVDDEPHVLSAIRRGLRNDFKLVTAEGSKEALALFEQGEKFSVIVSDCRMPEMDGIQLLERIAQLSPTTIRILLTGNTDQETAVRAVNDGDVFRFLNKPCNSEQLKLVLGQALRQFELVTVEKDLLEQTLKGSIQVLADLLGIVKPESFGRSNRLRRKAREVADHVDGIDRWQLDAAALLSQLGCVNVAESTLNKLLDGEVLDRQERADFISHPSLGAELIGRIPRMERVAEIILYQNKTFDGRGFPTDDKKGEQIPLEARVLSAVLAYDELKSQDISDAAIMEELRATKGRFDPKIIDALEKSVDLASSCIITRMMPSEMRLGLVIEQDVKNAEGVMLLCSGQEVTPAIMEHLLKFQKSGAITKRILVSEPKPEPEPESAERDVA